MTTTTTTWRKPTAAQIATLRRIADDLPAAAVKVVPLLARRWADGDTGLGSRVHLTASGRRILDDAEAIAKVAAISRDQLPDVQLRKRMYNRRWLGWEVMCHAGCAGGYYGTRWCVWATNDHEARDKWAAEAAYAVHVLRHLEPATQP